MSIVNKILDRYIDDPTLYHVLFISVTILLAVLISNLLRVLLYRFFEKASKDINADPTKYKFMKNAVSAIVYLVALIIIFHSIPELRSISVTLFAGAGVLAAIIGFASQEAFSNIIGGIFIVMFKPFRVGDIVSIDEKYSGRVEDITLRHTVINNYENRRVIIPNSAVNNLTILNSSIVDQKVCMFVEVGIAYDADIDLAIHIMVEESLRHPNCIDNRSTMEIANGDPQIDVKVIRLSDSSIDLRAWVWADDAPKGFDMKCDLLKSISQRFAKEGVEIPYPYRNVIIKNKEIGVKNVSADLSHKQ